MNPDLNTLLWPASRFSEAVAALSRASRVGNITMEALATEMSYADFERRLPTLGPALLQMPGEDGFLAILTNSTLLSPDRTKVKIDLSAVRAALCSEMEAPVLKQIQETLELAEVPVSRQARARAAILRERFSAAPIPGIWLLRLPPSANFWLQLRQARVPQRLVTLAGAHALQYVLWILAWWMIGQNVFSGRGSRNWLVLWGLLLLSLVPIRVLITWLQGQIAIGAGARLKQRLFYGALRLEPDSIRHQGAGQLLGRVIESEAVEALALSGGFLALVAIIELAIAIFVLAAGAGGVLHSVLLLAWLAVAAFIGFEYYRRNRLWTDVRLSMTHDLVESMAGHRTRLAQLPPARWHDGEDEALERYLKASKTMDRSTTALLAIVPRGWLVLSLAGLFPAFARGIDSPARIAIAVGGMILAYRAFKRLSAGAWQLAGAAVAWQRVAVLFNSAKNVEQASGLLPSQPKACAILEVQDLLFRYNHRTEPVFRNCTFQISSGDRVVLEGPSGGGKSTLAALLTGLRE